MSRPVVTRWRHGGAPRAWRGRAARVTGPASRLEAHADARGRAAAPWIGLACAFILALVALMLPR